MNVENNKGSKPLSPDSLNEFPKGSATQSLFSADSLENRRSFNSNESARCDRGEENSPMAYLDKEVFPNLLPCFEQMLFAAKENDVLKVQKSRFNGLDYLAELLWNRNPLHPERRDKHVEIFDIPFVKCHLEQHPRPFYPKSWLWTPSEAAVVIQAAVRGHLVRRRPDVQELREFWRTLAKEKPKVELTLGPPLLDSSLENNHTKTSL